MSSVCSGSWILSVISCLPDVDVMFSALTGVTGNPHGCSLPSSPAASSQEEDENFEELALEDIPQVLSQEEEEETFETVESEDPSEALSPDPTGDPSAGLREPAPMPTTLRLLLVGRSGTGKSATGNSILGQRVFESRLSARPVTQAVQQARCDWQGLELQVVDTPDLLGSGVPADTALRDTCAAIAGSAPGPHAVLLVTQLGRFTEQDRVAVRRLQELLGAAVLAHTVLVFTHVEDLGGDSLDEFARDTDNRALATLDALCSRRHCGFDNRAEGAEREAQLRELMRQVDTVLWENSGRHYSNAAYRYCQQHPAPPDMPTGLLGQGQPCEEGALEEPWPEGLFRVQKEAEGGHRRLLAKASM